jgi:general secretion pathway protein I
MRLRRAPRPGLSLIEVIVSLAIFLFSLIALGQMVNFAGNLAAEARTRGTAARLAQSKLAEVVAGAVPLEGGGGSCEDEPGYEWQVSAEPGPAEGLYNVTVTVSRKEGGGHVVSVSLSQLVYDPQRVGHLNDYSETQIGTGTPASTSGSSGTGGATGATGTGGAPPSSGAGGGAGAGAGGGGARPAGGGMAGGGNRGGGAPPGGPGGGQGGGNQGGGNRGGNRGGGNRGGS